MPATIKTMLHRLVGKKILTYDLQGNRYEYRSRVRRSDCVRAASRSFLARVFDGESAGLLATISCAAQNFRRTKSRSCVTFSIGRRLGHECVSQS